MHEDVVGSYSTRDAKWPRMALKLVVFFGVSRSLAACDWRARLIFLAKDLMDHGCGVSDVPH